jgi:hypothetical protein
MDCGVSCRLVDVHRVNSHRQIRIDAPNILRQLNASAEIFSSILHAAQVSDHAVKWATTHPFQSLSGRMRPHLHDTPRVEPAPKIAAHRRTVVDGKKNFPGFRKLIDSFMRLYPLLLIFKTMTYKRSGFYRA